MIVSASYRTDIPAFYGEWFINRLHAGYCNVFNPYSRKPYAVDLRPEAVDGFVFWTKNLTPFLPRLAEVHERGYPFIVQYTINSYPRELETSVIDSARSVQHMHRLARDYSPLCPIWRYDPILISTLTPAEAHLEHFARLAAVLEGATNEVVISFAQVYEKSQLNLNIAAAHDHFKWHNPDDAAKLALAARFVEIAARHGMTLTVCSQRDYTVAGSQPARCIDASRLAAIAGHRISAPIKGNRAECCCHESRDIGEYDTCPHGCVYCYAVRSPGLARSRYHSHDPQSEFLYHPTAKTH
ncbi:MAG: DUF1848 domain-containing protein [Bryobacterales bacterium]|nr:DUF1848 domain-containing protein [Bryobacterales bacterium]